MGVGEGVVVTVGVGVSVGAGVDVGVGVEEEVKFMLGLLLLGSVTVNELVVSRIEKLSVPAF